MHALIPDWMRSQPEVYTWRSAVPVVCFNYVHMHHIDRVIRQYGGEQPIPRLPVDVTRHMSSIGRGDNVWWPTRLHTWYDGWRRRRAPKVLVTVHHGGRSDLRHVVPTVTCIPQEENIRLRVVTVVGPITLLSTCLC
ncbi:hypothetical protein PIB30_004861 [Stylosanthes scabra]|uniref:Uncharacterized protein n=1 Tax=Stylosanthes scabra TaxID=79078 RepID=A0ABU6V3Y5_9FABA|nr:hypothetical protein [Stylosanthes scabra]